MTPILFLSPRVPWPLNTGAKIRTHALLAALTGAFHVDYAGFLQPDLTAADARNALAACTTVSLFDEQYTSRPAKLGLAMRTLATACPATIAKYWNQGLAEHVHRWDRTNPGGMIHADHLHMAPYLQRAARTHRVIDEHNVEALILERLLPYLPAGPVRAYLRLQARRLRAYEAGMVRTADLVLAVSENDRQQLCRMTAHGDVRVVPNGVDTGYFNARPDRRTAQSGEMIFTGSMNWKPNEDAIRYFADRIMPLLNTGEPNGRRWRLRVVGQNPSARLQALRSKRIELTGAVPDVRPYMERAAVYVVPLRVGGGSRLKILEALAMGVPVVTTRIGCEGLDVQDGQHVLLADEPESFAAAIRRLHQDRALVERLVGAGRKLVEEHYDWQVIGRRLVNWYATGPTKPGKYVESDIS